MHTDTHRHTHTNYVCFQTHPHRANFSLYATRCTVGVKGGVNLNAQVKSLKMLQIGELDIQQSFIEPWWSQMSVLFNEKPTQAMQSQIYILISKCIAIGTCLQCQKIKAKNKQGKSLPFQNSVENVLGCTFR